jgi:hypothetical protein
MRFDLKSIHPDPKLASIIARLSNGGGNPPSVNAPTNYKPSTPDERGRWNRFLDFLASKGMGGNPELDKRDRTRGMELLNEFNKTNPQHRVDPAFIPRAQYESYLIRKKQEFPGLTPEQNKYAFANLSPQFRGRDISDVDNWLGSYTSKQYYPTFERVQAGKPKAQFGTDFETYTRTIPAGDNFKSDPKAAATVLFRSK